MCVKGQNGQAEEAEKKKQKHRLDCCNAQRCGFLLFLCIGLRVVCASIYKNTPQANYSLDPLN